MRIPALTTTFALALALAACGGSGGSDANNSMSTDINMSDDGFTNDALSSDALGNDAGMNGTAANGMSDASMPTDAPGFAKAVAASDQFEIQSGKLAETMASSAEIKSFAKQLVTDHTKSSSDLKAAAAKAQPAVTVTPALSSEQQGMLDQLKAAKGADFDRAFTQMQTTAHQKALALLQGYAGNGDQQPLKDFASKTAPIVQQHLTKIQGMK